MTGFKKNPKHWDITLGMSCLFCVYMLRAVVVSQQAKLIIQAALCIFLSTPDSLLIFLNLLNHLFLCQEIFLTLFPFLSTLGFFLDPFFTSCQVLSCLCLIFFLCQYSSFFSLLLEVPRAISPFPNLFCWFQPCFIFCSVSMSFSLSFFSSRSSKKFLKCWG